MSNKIERAFGYEDQEVLLQAFGKYLEKVTGTKDAVMIKIIRSCIFSVLESENINFKDVRFFNEWRRMTLVEMGMKEFMKRIKAAPSVKEKLTSNGMKIYENWKRVKRENPSAEDLELNVMIDELTEAGFFKSKI